MRRGWCLPIAACLIACALAAPASAAPQRAAGCTAHRKAADSVGWQAKRIAPQAAWPVSRGRGVTVAVLDAGVNGAHPRLAGRVLGGTDLLRHNDIGDTDCDGHGSIVAGVIAGDDLGGAGFAGMAPEATVLPIRIGAATGQFAGASTRLATAVRYAVDHGATVINMSLTTRDTPQLRAAVAYAHDHDVVLVAAACADSGGTRGRVFPAAYPHVIAVSGTDNRDARLDASAGDRVDLAAPGRDVVGPAATSAGYARGSGASYAVPFVSGTAALIRSYRPTLTADQVTHRLLTTADHPAGGRDALVGYGVVNPSRALADVPDVPGGTAVAAEALPPASAAAEAPDGIRTPALWASAIGAAVVVLLLVLVAMVPHLRRRRRRRRMAARSMVPVPRQKSAEPPAADDASASDHSIKSAGTRNPSRP